MNQRTNDEIYQKVSEVKTLLTAKQTTCLSKAHFDAAIEKLSGPTPATSSKNAPGVAEQLAPLTGASEIITNIIKKEWIPLSVAAIGVLGIKFLNWEVLGKNLLRGIRLQLQPEKFVGVGRIQQPQAAPQAPITSIDVDRLKGMRSASISLSRALSDLTKEAGSAARQIA
ncbi:MULTISPECIES: hypothetical protein [Streptomyces]|uniref:hypothetical protein n=1 Tax=Streptomyces TaxID=1883 RepID=UPI000AC7EE7A|nr:MULTISPECIES: hypothetical protein [Streptomyces phaeochromogenes group]MCR3727048.1 hypothetical protein [Streptomyces umbrinus]GHH55122.1 hypothetical protein GCM10018775_59470 [Streptomyces umbrinus]